MVKEIDINMWRTAENNAENLDILIPDLLEKPIVQVYRYMRPDSNIIAEEVKSINIGVGIQGNETMIFLKFNERFRGYIVIK